MLHVSARRLSVAVRALALAAAASMLAWPAPNAVASHNQISILQEDPGLGGVNPDATLAKLRALGVQQIRFPARWVYIAPNPNSYTVPRGFNQANPSTKFYNFTQLDTVVREAAKFGLTVDLDVVGGAPNWALGPGAKK